MPGAYSPIAGEPSAAHVATLLQWAWGNVDQRIDVGDLARQAPMSERTLSRHVRRYVGAPPGEWLAGEPLRLAQRLLEQTDEAVGRVARRAGYASTATMRARFASRLRTSPSSYRSTFRGAGGSPRARAAPGGDAQLSR